MTDHPQELGPSQLDQVSGGVGLGVAHGPGAQNIDLAMINLQSLISHRQTAALPGLDSILNKIGI